MRHIGRRGNSTRIGVLGAMLVSVALLGTMFVLVSSAVATPLPPAPSKPVNTAPPVLTGTPAPGNILSCTPGSWTNSPTTFTYSWLRDGAPIAGQAASSYTVQTADTGHSITCQVTASKKIGEYTIPALASGAYKVHFSPEEGNYVGQYYNGKSSSGEANPLPVTVGNTTPGINAGLAQGGQIAGTVTDAGTHVPVAGVSVCASSSSDSKCENTNSAGEYTLSGLETGGYEVTFSAGGRYLTQFYNGKTSSGEANTVSVLAGGTMGSINAEMHQGGSIAGKVVAEGTLAPLAGIDVCASSSGNYGGCATTNAAGEYVLAGLVAGSYTVKFSAGSEGIYGEGGGGNYLTQYYHGKENESEATPVAVTVPNTTALATETLRVGGQIAGKVAAASTHGAVAGIEVCAFEVVTKKTGGCATTNATGEYTIMGLPAVSYIVRFSGIEEFFFFTETTPYLTQFYNDKTSESEAEPVPVTLAKTVIGIDAEMQPAGQISGKVIDATTHLPLANISVCASEPGVFFFFDCALTGANGEYTIAGLPSGSYVVEFSAEECEGVDCTPPNYEPQYYSGKLSEGEANSVSVSAPGTTGSINAEMHPGAEISGLVTSAVGGAPLGGVEVCASPVVSGSFGNCAQTNTHASSAIATSKALAVAAPNSNFTLAKPAVVNRKTGEIDFFFTVSNPGTFHWALFFRNSDVGFADSLGLSLQANGVAAGSSSGQVVAEVAKRSKKSKKCKRGYVKHGRRCVRLLVPFSSGAEAVPAGMVEIKVHPSSKAIKALKAGRTLHVSGTFTFQSALGGPSVSKVESVVVHLKKKVAKGRHGKGKKR